MHKNDIVYIREVDNYDSNLIRENLERLLLDNHLLDDIKENSLVAIKANLVASDDGTKAITVHQNLIIELVKILLNRNLRVVVGDSPAGLFTDSFLKPIYNRLGLNEIEKLGAHLNHNYNHHQVNSNKFKIVKDLDVCDWLIDADYIINFAKLKSHGMMSLSAATKNMFGSVPGTIKLEYHYKYNSHIDFSNMLIDIQEYYKPTLHIVDGIIGMEGNGPTQGKPKKLGLLFASKNPYNIDITICHLINLPIVQVPYLTEANKRGLCEAKYEDVKVDKNIEKYVTKDWDNIIHKDSIEFFASGNHKLIGKIAKKILETKPVCNKKTCIGCAKCANICPAKAIIMKNNRPKIDRKKCIKCFCCQEFCPVGSMHTHHTLIAKIIS